MRELSLNVMDVAQNSISAGASLIEIKAEEDTAGQSLVITIADNGRGMDEETLEKVQSPFYTTRTTRKVGLGVPLFKMACEMTGGSFSIRSKPDEGTAVQARFMTGHIDMVPLGAMDETVLLLISCNPDIDFVYTHARDGRAAILDTRELRVQLEDVPLSEPAVVAWLREYLRELEASLTDSA